MGNPEDKHRQPVAGSREDERPYLDPHARAHNSLDQTRATQQQKRDRAERRDHDVIPEDEAGVDGEKPKTVAGGNPRLHADIVACRPAWGESEMS